MRKTSLLLLKVRLLLLLLLQLAMLAMFGCAAAPKVSHVPDSLPAAASGVEKTGAHVESAERLNAAAKPMAGKQAKPLLDQVTAEHTAALAANAQTRSDVAAAIKQRDAVESDNAKLAMQVTKLTSGWGYRLQLWVTRSLWLLVTLTLAHFVLGAAGLFVPGVWGAALARVGVLINPAAWFQSARDNYYFRNQHGQS